jgi:hypothetical protein
MESVTFWYGSGSSDLDPRIGSKPLTDLGADEVTKQKKSRFFVLFLLDHGRIQIRTCDLRIRIRGAQKHTDLTVRIRIPNTGGGFIKGILREVRCTKSL